MKICLISNLYPPYVLGGAEKVVENEAKNLVKQGHDVFIITTSPNRNEKIEYRDDVKIYRTNPINVYKTYDHPQKPSYLKPLWHGIDLWNINSYETVKKILKTEKPDIVHIHNFKGLSISSFAAAKSLDLPLVFTAHDYSMICMRANLLNSSGKICENPAPICKVYNKILKELVNNKPDLIISPSLFVINKLESNGLFKNIKTKKIPLGIELNDIEGDKRTERNQINNKKYEKDYSIIKILYAGNLGEHKGVHILINAFKKIKNDNIQLNIVGKGICEEKLKKIANDDDRIRFHGFLEGEELLKMYERANLTIVPSIWYDNSPMVIYESFRCGTPVIGSRIGGIPELVEDGFNGYLFERGNSNELQILLESLINSPEKLKKLEIGAYESIQGYSMKKHIKQLEEVYLKVINKKS